MTGDLGFNLLIGHLPLDVWPCLSCLANYHIHVLFGTCKKKHLLRMQTHLCIYLVNLWCSIFEYKHTSVSIFFYVVLYSKGLYDFYVAKLPQYMGPPF